MEATEGTSATAQTTTEILPSSMKPRGRPPTKFTKRIERWMKGWTERERLETFMRITYGMCAFISDHSGTITEASLERFESPIPSGESIVGTQKGRVVMLKMSRQHPMTRELAMYDYTKLRNYALVKVKAAGWEPFERVHKQKVAKGSLCERTAKFKKGQRPDLYIHKRGRKKHPKTQP